MSISSSTSRCCQFSFKEIKEATNQFDGSKILGQGGEAKVYYAEIYIGSNKTPVAVKHLKENSKEFEREIYTLSKIHHPNLVSLIGYCDESGHKILVYEYMAKGSLSDYLKKKSSVSLSWLLRLNICLGAARGLQHLHTETDEFPKGIIHRDVKPGNILVGENWVGKLSDFGMFKLSNAGQDKSLMTTNLKGTSGYYAPEYIKNRRITRKIDVYAFGVVLFEVLCRKMPWDREDESYYADEDEDLGFWAQQNVDALIQGEITGDSLAVFTDIIGRSLQANPGRRPTMYGVVLDLQKALECQESVYLAKQLEGSPRNTTSLGISAQPDLDRGNLNHVHRSEEITNKQVTFSDPVSINNMDDLDMEGRQTEGEALVNWASKGSPNTTLDDPGSSYSPYLPPVLEEPSSSFSEAEDEDPLPAVESLQISGEAFPGRELQASGFSVNGTTSCNFEWVRHREDGSVNYIDGAKQPNYLVTADDVDTYLAVEVQPMDNRKRKGELVKVFANENRKIMCDPEMHSHIERAHSTGHASYKLSLSIGYLELWEAATLAIKRDGYSIKSSGPSGVVVTEKFYPSTIVTVPFGNPIEFSIIGSGGVERKLRAEDTITDIRCSRDYIVLILRLFIKKETIKDQVANMYLWPRTLEVPILDPTKALRKPVGILHVKVLKAMKLKKKDLMGASDPYVKVKLTDDKAPSKKTTVKHKNLNPEWNEEFNMVVKDPESQAVEFNVYDWEQVVKHDKMGMNVVPLKELTADEPKVITLDLLKNMDLNDAQNEKSRGQLEVELIYKPFKEEDLLPSFEDSSTVEKAPEGTPAGGGLLVVIVHEAQDVEGKHHTNPCVRIIFKLEERKTKHVKKNRDPRWDEEFHFMLEEPPINERMYVEVFSTSSRIGRLHPKETLGYVYISLSDVVNNRRINKKYHLIDSKNGRIQVELLWRTS